MSETSDSSGQPDHKKAWRNLTVSGLVVVVAVMLVARALKVDDATLERALVGHWVAVDPSDAVLHRREQPVAREELVIRADGTLSHIVELASKPGHPDNDPWKWKVKKGRLYVRFTGEDAGGQWLPGFAFSVTDNALSIHVKDHAPKEWVRR